MSITVASIMRNEAKRFLPSALESWKQFADQIVVLDDGSTDETPDLCEAAGCKVKRTNHTMQGSEWTARKALWHLARKHADGWVIWLDADQTLSDDPKDALVPPIACFKLYDLWSPTEYREDPWWTGHKRYWWPAVHIPSLPRGFEDVWPKRGWHSGHVPVNIPGERNPVHDVAVLHYAYATPELRAEKAKMYETLGPHLTPEERFHATTILTPKPHLKPLPFEPRWPLKTSLST